LACAPTGPCRSLFRPEARGRPRPFGVDARRPSNCVLRASLAASGSARACFSAAGWIAVAASWLRSSIGLLERLTAPRLSATRC
jgi:hypothetical protein